MTTATTKNNKEYFARKCILKNGDVLYQVIHSNLFGITLIALKPTEEKAINYANRLEGRLPRFIECL